MFEPGLNHQIKTENVNNGFHIPILASNILVIPKSSTLSAILGLVLKALSRKVIHGECSYFQIPMFKAEIPASKILKISRPDKELKILEAIDFFLSSMSDNTAKTTRYDCSQAIRKCTEVYSYRLQSGGQDPHLFSPDWCQSWRMYFVLERGGSGSRGGKRPRYAAFPNRLEVNGSEVCANQFRTPARVSSGLNAFSAF